MNSLKSASVHDCIILIVSAQNLEIVFEILHGSKCHAIVDRAIAGTFVEVAHVLTDIVHDSSQSLIAPGEPEVILVSL